MSANGGASLNERSAPSSHRDALHPSTPTATARVPLLPLAFASIPSQEYLGVCETLSETSKRAYDRLMGNLIAKIRQWLGLEKKSDAPKHGSDAP